MVSEETKAMVRCECTFTYKETGREDQRREGRRERERDRKDLMSAYLHLYPQLYCPCGNPRASISHDHLLGVKSHTAAKIMH